jgi:hypothetical protein
MPAPQYTLQRSVFTTFWWGGTGYLGVTALAGGGYMVAYEWRAYFSPYVSSVVHSLGASDGTLRPLPHPDIGFGTSSDPDFAATPDGGFAFSYTVRLGRESTGFAAGDVRLETFVSMPLAIRRLTIHRSPRTSQPSRPLLAGTSLLHSRISRMMRGMSAFSSLTRPWLKSAARSSSIRS